MPLTRDERARASVPDGFVRITSNALRGALVLRLGNGPVRLTEGGSVFQEYERPRRRSAIAYQGMRLHRLEVPLMLDGWRYNPDLPNAGVAVPHSVEVQVQLLESLSVSRRGVQSGPATIRVWGPVPHKSLPWFIEALEWGTDVIYVGQKRVRQDVLMKLVQRVEPELALAENERRPKTKVSYRIVRMPRQQTLRDLAAVMLGSSSRWREIRNMKGQPFSTPAVKAGTRIKVPRA